MKKKFNILLIYLLSFLSSCSQLSTPLYNSRSFASEQNCIGIIHSFFAYKEKHHRKNVSLENDLMAVHLTDFLPEKGVIKATTINRARFSATLHFSLGESVISHSEGNWDSKKYAVILPIKYLKNQMINLFAQDTFIIGDLVLPKEAILILPRGEKKPSNFLGELIYYENQNITSVVKETIKNHKKIELQADGAYPLSGLRVNGESVNPKEYLAPLLKDLPNVTFQLHSESPVGIVDILMHTILENWYYDLDKAGFALESLKYKRMRLKEALRVVDRNVRSMNLPEKARLSYKKNRIELNGFLNLIDMEIFLQEKHNKTFFNSGKELKNELLNTRVDTKDLKKTILENLDKWQEAPPASMKGVYILNFKKDFEWLPIDEVRRVIDENPDFYEKNDFYNESALLEMMNSSSANIKELVVQFKRTLNLAKEEYHFFNMSVTFEELPKESKRTICSQLNIDEIFKAKINKSLCP